MERNKTDALLGSFASAVGLALGELLLFAGRSEALGGCLASIETAAYATLISSDLSTCGAAPRGRSLAGAALRVVRTWYETDDVEHFGETMRALEEVLAAMGMHVAPTFAPEVSPDE